MTTIRTTLLIAGAGMAIVLAGLFACQTLYDPGANTAATPVVDRAAQLRQGAYLVRAGNCMACHTTPGGGQYAGGRAIATPFGKIYTSNITPDRASGIGSWSADDFWRAIHNGKSKDGSFLYPAFPYPSYTKVTRADSDAMYAYLMTKPAVRQPKRANELTFPYNQRPLLAFWRTLYFTPGEYEREPTRGEVWNRGAYLVQGLGHCAACHTARDALGGPLAERELGGGALPGIGWHASSITSHPQSGVGAMSEEALAALLRTGVAEGRAVAGPMAEVVGASLQHLSVADTWAMAAYLKTVTPVAAPAGGPAYAPADPAEVMRLGAEIYTKQCVACHGEQGQGHGTAYPRLAGTDPLGGEPPVNAIRMVLEGGFAPSTGGNPRPFGMPPFGHTLGDEEVAAVVTYVRGSWGNRASPVSPMAVNRLRGAGQH